MKTLAKLAALLLLPVSIALAGVPEDVSNLQQKWEQIRYKTPAAAQEAQYEQLVAEAQKTAAGNPGSADVLIWYAIIESTYAGAKGGLGALSHVKSARKALEQAIAINPDALNGSAYTSLGSLYYQVPGWPIGFGDDKKALEYLKKGLAINPDGIDPNYFYGDFLFRKGEYAEAERALNKALQAAPRPGRKVADEGRRGEIEQLLAKIAAKRK
ncbi:tetratricopeptide repeat protein [Pseudoduganella sp. DS3]|uniref:Tetratricopeptide repeat protein n=1 Tax=Pseudoduganella guangdongensis TaxID=2692179 RepID=A0A6N9HIN8_9BURK|nr:tetratricopeptide repeat protein [Pseudoduganella guangdongensis]MYN03219.1 tetratricopeptide repeat protein [Pseudoduganella guangdongensis]